MIPNRRLLPSPVSEEDVYFEIADKGEKAKVSINLFTISPCSSERLQDRSVRLKRSDLR